MYRILVVEDDPVIASQIKHNLERWDLEAGLAEDLSNVMASFEAFDPHLVIMDVALPFFNGFYWCGLIRKRSKVPVIFLSSRGENMDIVMAMNMGADDYITKPVSMEVLTAKLQAMLRRSYDYELKPPLTLRGAVLDVGGLFLQHGDTKTELTRNETRILQCLLGNKQQPVSRERLMIALWDDDQFVDDNTLSVNVNRLRRKLEQAGFSGCIVTHKNMGYGVNE